MSWVPSKKRFAQIAFTAFLLGEASYVAAQQQVLILRSVGPSARYYRPGTRVAANAVFNLRSPADSVVILSRGRTRTFRGPGRYLPTQQIPSQYAYLYRQRRTATGAVRGEVEQGPAPRPGDVWQIDVGSPGSVCYRNGRMALWRSSESQAVRLTITPQIGAPQTVSWPAGQSVLPWPSSIPLRDGATYQFAIGNGAPNRVTATAVGDAVARDPEQLGDALTTANCRRQMDVFIATNTDAMDNEVAP